MSKVSAWIDDRMDDEQYDGPILCVRVRGSSESIAPKPADAVFEVPVEALKEFLARFGRKSVKPPLVVLPEARAADLIANVVLPWPFNIQGVVVQNMDQHREEFAECIRSIVVDRILATMEQVSDAGALREGALVMFGGKSWGR